MQESQEPAGAASEAGHILALPNVSWTMNQIVNQTAPSFGLSSGLFESPYGHYCRQQLASPVSNEEAWRGWVAGTALTQQAMPRAGGGQEMP